MSESKKPVLYCSFCGNPHLKVRVLIAGPRVYICDECVALCMTIVADSEAKAGTSYGKFLAFHKKQPTSLEKFNAFFDTKSPAEKTKETTKKIVAKCDDIIAMLEGVNRKVGG